MGIFDEIESSPKPPATKNTPQFDLSPADTSPVVVITIAGEKGEGKTAFAFNETFFPGSIIALSFDKKTAITKKYMYNDDPRITVYDAVKYLDPSPEAYTETSALTIEYIKAILNKYRENRPDWIVFDGLSELSTIVEMCMRKIHNLQPFEAFSNKNLWKTRKIIMRNLHLLACSIAKKGIIYTTYTEYDNTIVDGEVFNTKKIPKWQDIVLQETDAIIFVYTEENKVTKGLQFFAKVVSSKIPMFRTGDVINVTR